MNLELHRGTDLDRVIDALGVGVFTLDREGCFAGWSAGAARVTGFTAEDVRGRPCGVLDHDPGLRLAALWTSVAEGAPRAEQTATLRHRDGRDVHLLVELRRLEEAGEIAGCVGTLVDWSMHVLANQRLARIDPPAKTRQAFQNMIGEGPAMTRVFREIEQAADVDVVVLIRGETGTGKELAARAIHALSKRKRGPLVCVNCSAIPDPLLESELFGHVRGAFTGALRDKRGVFEEAHGGTLFLDEVGDLGAGVQVKLLRALQEREIRRVGGDRTVKVDVRVVSATHRNLAAMVAAGEFREDLYYRLRVFELLLPALRDRKEDVPLLVDHFVGLLSRRHEKTVRRVSDAALACLTRYAWPGNIREFRNAIEHAFVTVRGDTIEPANLPVEVRPQPGPALAAAAPPPSSAAERAPGAPPAPGAEVDWTRLPAHELDRLRILEALKQTGGRKTAAAKLLGISRVTLWKRIKKHAISPIYGSLPGADPPLRT